MLFVTLRMKIHFSHVICMLSFGFFYIFAMSHHRTQSNFYLSTTHICIYVYVCVYIYIYIYKHLFFSSTFLMILVNNNNPTILELKHFSSPNENIYHLLISLLFILGVSFISAL